MISTDYLTIKTKLNKARSEKDFVTRSLKANEEELTIKQYRLAHAEKAQIIFQAVAKKTQENLEVHFSDLVTLALQSVFDEPLEFTMTVVPRRNKTEVDLFLGSGGENKDEPMESCGGGALDIASFALRVAFWSLRKNRHTLILDEPFKFVSPDLQHKVSDMVRLLSDKLKLQIIMVSHADEINYSADKTFIVSKVNGISSVQESK
jgi:DNA repair exonuclease SbcCD ATPase subunit